MTLDALRTIWLGSPAGDDLWATAAASLALLAASAPFAAAGYRRGTGR
jgi:hypothetical protein